VRLEAELQALSDEHDRYAFSVVPKQAIASSKHHHAFANGRALRRSSQHANLGSIFPSGTAPRCEMPPRNSCRIRATAKNAIQTSSARVPPLVVAGPSGVGKGTLIKKLQVRRPSWLASPQAGRHAISAQACDVNPP
jgi:hypothetical protein